jgi:hypothetical protein
MNKAHSMIAAFSLVIGAFLVLPSLNIAFAQYGSAGNTGGVTLEEQLKLAKSKITNAQQAGAYGSGTSMFGYSLDNTVIMIIVIAVVFGGISAAFFAMGTKGKKKHLEASVDGYSSGGGSSSGKFCTNCGAPAGNQKFCGNCGTQI